MLMALRIRSKLLGGEIRVVIVARSNNYLSAISHEKTNHVLSRGSPMCCYAQHMFHETHKGEIKTRPVRRIITREDAPAKNSVTMCPGGLQVEIVRQSGKKTPLMKLELSLGSCLILASLIHEYGAVHMMPYLAGD